MGGHSGCCRQTLSKSEVAFLLASWPTDEVGHNAVEFVLDFGQHYPDSQQARMYTRIITTPIYIRALFKTIGESIDRYERTFGAIPNS